VESQAMDGRHHWNWTRRGLLVAAGNLAGALSAASFTREPAQATTPAMNEAIRKVVGESAVRKGKVELDLPPIIENGNTVPLTVSVESPMTETDHVKAIHVFNEKNPQPNVVTFRFGPRAGRASISTRIRLADSQNVVAIAQMSDGSFWSDSVAVIVTLAACAEEYK
jgi:sulfur-oxidizing protein SoxY